MTLLTLHWSNHQVPCTTVTPPWRHLAETNPHACSLPDKNAAYFTSSPEEHWGEWLKEAVNNHKQLFIHEKFQSPSFSIWLHYLLAIKSKITLLKKKKLSYVISPFKVKVYNSWYFAAQTEKRKLSSLCKSSLLENCYD